MPETAIISEVAPRDGIQSIAGALVATEAKIALIQACYDAGLRRMEVGSFVSPKAIPQMAQTEIVLAACRKMPGLESTVLVPNRRWRRSWPRPEISSCSAMPAMRWATRFTKPGCLCVARSRVSDPTVLKRKCALNITK